MNAIVPLNIAALRVNQNDYNKVVGNFQGKTAMFEKMPWADPGNSYTNSASTGDKIFQPLGVTDSGGPLISPANSLGAGIHLHWELPEYFKRGQQLPGNPQLIFPRAPNRWLVTRFLSMYDQPSNSYGPVASKSWVVESDYITANKPGDGRPHITVPLPANPGFQQQPFMYMGRVVDLVNWNPASEPASSYLPSQTGPDGQPCYLTSVGFVGPYFSSYYPECCSVFGFWDNFSDVPAVQAAIGANDPLQFRATYQVMGWINEKATDPLDNIVSAVTVRYNDYVDRCLANNVAPVLTPINIFENYVGDQMKWTFNGSDLTGTVDENHHITQLVLPTQTICAGMIQEVVWNMMIDTGTTYFLSSGQDNNPSVWPAPTEIAVGNSTEEALAALLKYDIKDGSDDPNVLTNFEYLLDALQMGLLNGLEKTPNKLISLEEALHNKGFENINGGYTWLIANTKQGGDQGQAEAEEITLPIALAEQLYLLNNAQKQYDMGRGALSLRRKQLFMDWIRYVKSFQLEATEPYLPQTALNNFMWTSTGGELNDVVNYGNTVGVLGYVQDKVTRAVTGVNPPAAGIGANSLAAAVYNSYQALYKELAALNDSNANAVWTIQCQIADYFQLPSEPVILMEGDMMEPAQRNGRIGKTFVRVSPEILSGLSFTYNANAFAVDVASLQGVPVVNTSVPAALQQDVQSLTGEVFLLAPMLAGVIATALAAAGGAGNPAIASPGDFTVSMMYAQGGLSPLDMVPAAGGIPVPACDSLFALVQSTGYKPGTALSISVAAPQAITVTWTNAAKDAFAAGPIGWNTQYGLTGFPASRVDPFLSVFMIWNVNFSPLQWEQDPDKQLYGATNVTDFFELDADGVDYVNKTADNIVVPFIAPTAVGYDDDASMRSGATGVLSYQITNYLDNFPGDPEKEKLQQVAALYSSRKILSQAMSGFNSNLVLTTYVAQVAVENLVAGKMDNITPKVNAAAGATAGDNWYNDDFTSLEPIASGLPALGNFGPLRAGFMDIVSIEIVDVFGQRMDLVTNNRSPQGGLDCITSYATSPNELDQKNAGRVYLAPRVVTPTRVWFKWLSATHDNSVPGVTDDFVETNAHPATAPICGWVMPNHLDNNLFFYDADGAPIGSFGVEHGANVYRTRAGNITNSGTPQVQLTNDIGAAGSPSVNAHVANMMWFIFKQSSGFLQDMMNAIQASETFVGPANYAQDNSLAVLIGRPLAITRAVVGIETLGNLLPLNQADTSVSSPFPQDVLNGRCSYPDRMAESSGNLGNVNFPVRLGELVNLDDGLVGYLLDAGGNTDPYGTGPLYMPGASATGSNGVVGPLDTTIQVTLNQAPRVVTMLVDPRAGVHATTGILPVCEINIPADQYVTIMNSLAVNFVTRPMLQMAQGAQVPLPAEAGYGWSWITPGAADETPLAANAVNESPIYGYSPQTIQEGWLSLSPLPPPAKG